MPHPTSPSCKNEANGLAPAAEAPTAESCPPSQPGPVAAPPQMQERIQRPAAGPPVYRAPAPRPPHPQSPPSGGIAAYGDGASLAAGQLPAGA